MNRILNLNGSAATAEPELSDTERAQRAAAKRASDREEAAFRIRQYLIARIQRPKEARKMPDPVDLQVLLDERQGLYEHLANMQQQATLNVLLILRALGVDRVEITPVMLEEIAGWNVRQSEGEHNTMILELVRPDPADEEGGDANDS